MKKLLVVLFVTLSSSLFNGCIAQTWSAMDIGLYSRDLYAFSVVNDIVEYNNVVYAAGGFTNDGSINCNSVAKWNGSAWDSVNNEELYQQYALQIYNGNLVAGGFESYNLSQWNGTSWSELGTGNYFLRDQGAIPVVRALTIYDGNLVAAGAFDSIPGMTANNIAYWNGTSWNTYGSGLKSYHFGTSYCITSLAVYNGNLIAAGYFDSTGAGTPASAIASWNGTTWSALGSGINGIVNALAVHNGDLYAGGEFDTAGGNPVYNIAKWDGSTWTAVGGYMYQYDEIDALTSYNGDLYAGGDFDTIGGIAANSIAYWNGAVWHAIGSGIVHSRSGPGIVYSIYGNNYTIYAGGFFDSAGGISAINIAMCAAPTGINKINNASNFSVYPNPSNGVFTIQSSVVSGQSSVEVYNVLGVKIYDGMLNQVQHDYEIDISNQPIGVYLYRIITSDGNLFGEGKLIIQK